MGIVNGQYVFYSGNNFSRVFNCEIRRNAICRQGEQTTEIINT